MKHLVRVVAVVGILVVPAAAQAQVGVRVGVNSANLSVDPKPPEPPEIERLIGFVAGAFVTLPVNDIFGFQPEALYSRQGAKLTDSGVTLRAKLDYVQVPLLARVRTGARSPLAVLFGPSLGFKTRARLSGPNIPDEVNEAFDEQFKGFDFGLVAGAAFEAGPLVLDGRYTWGLTNIAKDTFEGEPNSDKARNRVLSFSLGLRF